MWNNPDVQGSLGLAGPASSSDPQIPPPTSSQGVYLLLLSSLTWQFIVSKAEGKQVKCEQLSERSGAAQTKPLGMRLLDRPSPGDCRANLSESLLASLLIQGFKREREEKRESEFVVIGLKSPVPGEGPGLKETNVRTFGTIWSQSTRSDALK